MRRARSPRAGKSSIGVALSLGFLVLGIGCIGWALMNIRTQSRGPATSEVKQFTLAGDATVSPGPENASGTPGPKKAAYLRNPATGATIGSLSIPVLNQELPVIQGTGTDELKRGVGHITGSALPGEKDNCVLSGHRDTVFAELGKLKKGDRVIVRTSTGTYTYEIKGIRIVGKNDRTVVVHTDHAVLTLSTCYPFQYVGSAPDRYVLTASLVTSK